MNLTVYITRRTPGLSVICPSITTLNWVYWLGIWALHFSTCSTIEAFFFEPGILDHHYTWPKNNLPRKWPFWKSALYPGSVVLGLMKLIWFNSTQKNASKIGPLYLASGRKHPTIEAKIFWTGYNAQPLGPFHDRLLAIPDDDEMSSQPLSYILTEPYVTNVAIPQRTTHIYHVPFYLL